MKMFIRKELYFEIEIEDGSDRNIVARSLEQAIDPVFEDFISKICFDKDEKDALAKLVGSKVSLRILPRSQYLKQLNPK